MKLIFYSICFLFLNNFYLIIDIENKNQSSEVKDIKWLNKRYSDNLTNVEVIDNIMDMIYMEIKQKLP